MHTRLLRHTESEVAVEGENTDASICLAEEIKLFFQQNNNTEVQGILSNNEWLLMLAYLSDIFSRLNDLNISL